MLLAASAVTFCVALFGALVVKYREAPTEFAGEDLEYSIPTPPFADLSHVTGDPKILPGEVGIRVPVLMYHHIRPILRPYTQKDRLYTVTPNVFETQMQALVDAGYHAISPDDLRDAIQSGTTTYLASKPVLLTFDDGFRDQYANGFPILQRLELQATFFLISKERSRGGLTDAMAVDLSQSPLITIAAHTQHHPILARLSVAARDREIQGSKEDLESLTGNPIRYFAYPFGSWTEAIAHEVKAMGFELAFGIRMGSLHTPSSRFELRRIIVRQGDDVVKVLDRFSSVDAAAKTR